MTQQKTILEKAREVAADYYRSIGMDAEADTLLSGKAPVMANAYRVILKLRDANLLAREPRELTDEDYTKLWNDLHLYGSYWPGTICISNAINGLLANVYPDFAAVGQELVAAKAKIVELESQVKGRDREIQACENVVRSYNPETPDDCGLHDRVYWLGRQLEEAEKKLAELRQKISEAESAKHGASGMCCELRVREERERQETYRIATDLCAAVAPDLVPCQDTIGVLTQFSNFIDGKNHRIAELEAKLKQPVICGPSAMVVYEKAIANDHVRFVNWYNDNHRSVASVEEPLRKEIDRCRADAVYWNFERNTLAELAKSLGVTDQQTLADCSRGIKAIGDMAERLKSELRRWVSNPLDVIAGMNGRKPLVAGEEMTVHYEGREYTIARSLQSKPEPTPEVGLESALRQLHAEMGTSEFKKWVQHSIDEDFDRVGFQVEPTPEETTIREAKDAVQFSKEFAGEAEAGSVASCLVNLIDLVESQAAELKAFRSKLSDFSREQSEGAKPCDVHGTWCALELQTKLASYDEALKLCHKELGFMLRNFPERQGGGYEKAYKAAEAILEAAKGNEP